MIRSICLFSIVYLLAAIIPVSAQNRHGNNREMSPELRRRALVLNIDTRVFESNQEEVWNQTERRMAIPGAPVVLQLVGSNIVIAVQFTPFIRRHNKVLAAQGQIWIDDPEKGTSYYTSIQTIPMEFGEPIYFYPLGSSQDLNSSIEIIITVNQYNEAEDSTENDI